MKLINNWFYSLILTASSGIGVIISQPSYAATLYNITDLGNLGSSEQVRVTGINNLGQAAGFSTTGEFNSFGSRRLGAFRTAPNSPINPTTDNLAALQNIESLATGINDSGQVVGSFVSTNVLQAFRTAPNSPINLETDNLISDSFDTTSGNAINNSGQAVVEQDSRFGSVSYRTLPNRPVNFATDNIGSLGSADFIGPRVTQASGINDSGQVVGTSFTVNPNNFDFNRRAFRTAPNSAINPATDDLGTLSGTSSQASAINNSGQVVGTSTISNGQERAFRTAPNSAINPATDDLGTLGGTFSGANDINNLGQVVGNSTIANGEQRAFLFDEGKMFDLNNLIPANSGFTLNYANGINDRGQIVAGTTSSINRIFLLTPIASTSISEPSSFLGILSIGALCAVAIKRRVM